MRRALTLVFVLLSLVLTGLLPGVLPGVKSARAGEVSPGAIADAQRLVAVLEYVAADYPAASATQSKFELDEQRAFLAEAIAIAKSDYVFAASLPRLESLEAQVAKGSPEGVGEVRRTCATLIEEIVEATGIARAPRHPPELARGKTLFEAQCATCHGADGSANTAAAQKLDPKPVSFRQGPRIDSLTPFRAFNTITYGVKGTGMPAFATLAEHDRWAVAFYVLSLRHRCEGDTPRVALERLANASDTELAKDHGQAAVSCLRTNLPAVDVGTQIDLTKSLVQTAMQSAKRGDLVTARQAILDAYLSGVEPIEPLLKSRDPGLVSRLEEAFLALRLAAERGDRDLDPPGARVLSLLETARRSGSKVQASSVFGLSFLILMREGFEVVVVLGALLAVLKKMGARDQTAVVHAGWIAALVVGALVFVFARKWVAGSNREWLEGVVALAAVVMLLYAAFWLNARSNTRKFMGELREKMKGALADKDEKGTPRVAVGLFLISFSSMLRESVETAIFLQGLAIDSAKATAWGAVSGLLVLVVVVVAMGRWGLKLPLKLLFDVSTILLFATAVVLLGKGIHALQEVGIVPLRPIPMFRVDLLGIFPDVYGLAAQVVLAAAPLVVRHLKKGDDARADAHSAA